MNQEKKRQPPTCTMEDLDYDLPEDLIAQVPPTQRDASRLLVLERTTGHIADRMITDLPDLLRPGDLLVLNNTKVLPAKLRGHRETGGVVEGLFVAELSPGIWQVMLTKSRRLKIGETLQLTGKTDPVGLTLRERLGDGHWHAEVTPPQPAEAILQRIGQPPLPPYIKRDIDDPRTSEIDPDRYQTVFAATPGAVAAPTAGLHLTEAMLDTASDRGIDAAMVTLHVGVGTFKPIATDRLDDHDMHTEWYNVPQQTVDAVRACRARGGRVVAVGTTAVRTLESAADPDQPGQIVAGSRHTDIFLYPPYRFWVVDVLLTNFHLPRSTLIALVMAFAGIENTKSAYTHAMTQRYRFYSYGDAMLITDV